MYVLKYDPIKNKIASWDVGQACVFMSNNECVDSKMTKSFRFR